MYDERSGKLHFWLHVRLLQPDVRPDARDRHRRHAAPRRRLRRSSSPRMNLVDLDRELPARPELAGLPLQHGRELAPRAARRRQPVARADARVAGLLAAADLQLRRRSRRWSAARTSTASPARSTASSSRRPRPSPPAGSVGRQHRPRSEVKRMANVLVVANETHGGRSADRRRCKRARRAGRCELRRDRARRTSRRPAT